MKVSENTSVAMPIKNMVGIIVGVSMGIFAYTEITARLTSLETSRELMNADLLKASEQTTVDKEQYILLEELYKTTDQHTELLNKRLLLLELLMNELQLLKKKYNVKRKTKLLKNPNIPKFKKKNEKSKTNCFRAVCNIFGSS